jgi:hypothetical protein
MESLFVPISLLAGARRGARVGQGTEIWGRAWRAVTCLSGSLLTWRPIDRGARRARVH